VIADNKLWPWNQGVERQHLNHRYHQHKKWVAGAGLDVFEKELPSPNNPLLKMKNVVLLPHIGSATFPTRTKMAEVAAKNLLNVLKGQSLINLANLDTSIAYT